MVPRRRSELGCGFFLWTGAVTCVLLVVNGTIVATFYAWIRPAAYILSHPKLGQAVMFVGPVVLVFVEWWVIDAVWYWRRKRAKIEE